MGSRIGAFNLMAYSPATKHVFIVDDDPTLPTKQTSSGCWQLVSSRQGCGGHKQFNRQPVEPANLRLPADEKGTLETKLIFDCTRPLSAGKFPAATRVPPDVKERMNPGDYVRALSEGDLAHLRGGK